VLGNLCCGCNSLMHNKFSCGHTVLENNLRENSSLSYLFTKPTKQVFKFVRTKTETCALKLETIRGPSALSVYISNLCLNYVQYRDQLLENQVEPLIFVANTGESSSEFDSDAD
jgi:hypothetical protein